MYSIKNIDGKVSNTAKGVNIATEFNEFKDTLFNKKIMRHKMRRIQSKKHELGTYEIKKISLSCFDNKQYVQDDSINTLYICIFSQRHRFSKMKKKRISQMKKGSHKWSQIKISEPEKKKFSQMVINGHK